MNVKGISAFIISMIALFTGIAPAQGQDDGEPEKKFITIEGKKLIRDGKPYHFIGTNLWYAPILGSTGEGGNRERLHKELDYLKAMGIENLRILAGADKGSTNANSVVPALQDKPGELDESLLIGLDYTLAELEKRNMTAVIYLTNSWDWSGGYGFYLRECGYGDSPNAAGEGYYEYVKYASNFVAEERALELYYNHVKAIVSRKNTITGRYYKDEPSIMAWQICNEPRPFSKDNQSKMARWLSKSAKLIKSIDSNHLVSTGSEGYYGCEANEHTCEFIHGDPNIDYLTVHVWPLNWGWASRNTPDNDIDAACQKSGEYEVCTSCIEGNNDALVVAVHRLYILFVKFFGIFLYERYSRFVAVENRIPSLWLVRRVAQKIVSGFPLVARRTSGAAPSPEIASGNDTVLFGALLDTLENVGIELVAAFDIGF